MAKYQFPKKSYLTPKMYLVLVLKCTPSFNHSSKNGWTMTHFSFQLPKAWKRTVLKDMKKFFEHVPRDVKSYWISPDTPWNSKTVFMLLHMLQWYKKYHLGITLPTPVGLWGQTKSWANEKKLLTKVVRYVSVMKKICFLL